MDTLFACDQCDTVDSVELAGPKPASGPWLCTCCQGRPWHGQFARLEYNRHKDHVANRSSGVGLS